MTPWSELRSRGLGDRTALWTYLAYEWAAGAALLTIITATTRAPRADHAAMYAIGAMACACVAVMLAGRNRLSERLVEPALVVGHLLISAVVYFSGDPTTFLAMFYVWLNVYAFHFFGLRSGWAHTVLALACYAVVLVALSGGLAYTAWLMTAGTMVVVGSMVGSLRARVDRLVAKLADAATHDPLTGLMNRRGFGDVMTREIERCRRGELSFSLLIADVDHFKLINDRSGHHAGDEALRRVGGLLETGKRQADTAARIGGEEFALLLPDTDADGARALAERLRRRLREDFADDAVPITLSVGIATFPDHAGSADDLLRVADDAMYAAKRLGRDRCEVVPALATRLATMA